MCADQLDNSDRYPIARWRFINHLFDRYGVELPYENILSENFRYLVEPGDWVVDVGAHLGVHTCPLLKAVGPTGRVVAIEPLEYFANKIRDRFQNAPNVQVFNIALSNFNGTAQFTVARGTPEESGLQRKGSYIFPDVADLTEVQVVVRTLDDLLIDWTRLDYIKIDVEGAELDCLAGTDKLIRGFRPIVSFECGKSGYMQYSKTLDDFEKFAQRHSYKIFDIFGSDITGELRLIADRAHTWDFYYVPAERSEVFASKLYNKHLP